MLRVLVALNLSELIRTSHRDEASEDVTATKHGFEMRVNDHEPVHFRRSAR